MNILTLKRWFVRRKLQDRSNWNVKLGDRIYLHPGESPLLSGMKKDLNALRHEYRKEKWIEYVWLFFDMQRAEKWGISQ